MEELGRGTCVILSGAPAVMAGRGGAQGLSKNERESRGGEASAMRAEWRSESQDQARQAEQ